MGRVDWPTELLPCEMEQRLHAGDYAQQPKGSFWVLRAPNGQIGTITPATHSVEEHEDGTITVNPSLDYKSCPQGDLCPLCKESDKAYAMMWFGWTDSWHGWLRRGVWTSAALAEQP